MSTGQMIVQALIGAQSATTAPALSVLNAARGSYAFEGTLRSVSSHATTNRPHENVTTKSSQSEREEEAESGLAETEKNVAVGQNTEFAGALIQTADITPEVPNGDGFPAMGLLNADVAARALRQRDISSDSSGVSQPSPNSDINTTITLTGNGAVNGIMGKISLASAEAVSAAAQSGTAAGMESMDMSVISVSRMQGQGAYHPELDVLLALQQNIVTEDVSAIVKSEALTMIMGVAEENQKALLDNAEMDGQDIDAQTFGKEEFSLRNAVETTDQPEPNGKNMTLTKNGDTAVEENFNQSGNGSSDYVIGTQNQELQARQSGTESGAVLTDSSALSKHDVMRQVVSKVSEQATVLEKGNGFEQVVIRLTPESLGELKLNLRMENQYLKVEIVAENSSVRDELLRNSNALKDALARQNITMNSFDVSTGSNGNGSSAFAREDWRELVQQQRAPWDFAGDYRADTMNTKPQPGVYGLPVEHSMVDLHF